jgi:hypothetical protein
MGPSRGKPQRRESGQRLAGEAREGETPRPASERISHWSWSWPRAFAVVSNASLASLVTTKQGRGEWRLSGVCGVVRKGPGGGGGGGRGGVRACAWGLCALSGEVGARRRGLVAWPRLNSGRQRQSLSAD